jgi:hypothetical protein
MLDFEEQLANRKRAWQGRGAYSKIPSSYPALTPKPAKPATNSQRKKALKAAFPRYAARVANRGDDTEMGIFPLIASVIPMATNLVGSLLGKKSSKTGAPPPEAGLAKQVLDTLTSAGAGGGDTDIKAIVRNIVATVPSPVVEEVKKAIAAMKNKDSADVESRDLIVSKIDGKFQPQITAMLAALKAQNLQKQATYEHNRLVAKEAFRTGTTKALQTSLQSLQNVSKRLSAIEARLQNSAIVGGSTRIALLGGKNVIEQ